MYFNQIRQNGGKLWVDGYVPKSKGLPQVNGSIRPLPLNPVPQVEPQIEECKVVIELSKKKKHLFRFESMWTREGKKIIEMAWCSSTNSSGDHHIQDKIKRNASNNFNGGTGMSLAMLTSN